MRQNTIGSLIVRGQEKKNRRKREGNRHRRDAKRGEKMKRKKCKEKTGTKKVFCRTVNHKIAEEGSGPSST